MRSAMLPVALSMTPLAGCAALWLLSGFNLPAEVIRGVVWVIAVYAAALGGI